MNKARQQTKQRLFDVIDKWLGETQEKSDAPFDCLIGDNTVSLMTDAAFAVIEAVEDSHAYLKSEGMLEEEI